jgi:hypothetical protein
MSDRPPQLCIACAHMSAAPLAPCAAHYAVSVVCVWAGDSISLQNVRLEFS